MARIRSKDTGIEWLMAKSLDELGLKFDRHPSMYGKPDFLVGGKIAVFCDGDFWHGFKMRTNPRIRVTDNRDFWIQKIKNNRRRDKQVNHVLKSQGLVVLRFWEHEIKESPRLCAEKVKGFAAKAAFSGIPPHVKGTSHESEMSLRRGLREKPCGL